MSERSKRYTKTGRRAKQARGQVWKRHNITALNEDWSKGQEMARTDSRSLSNFIGVLIQREWQRRQNPPIPAA